MTRTTLRGLPLTGLVLATTLTLALSAGFSAQAATPRFMTVAHATPLRQGDVVKGALSSIQPMHIVVAVKLRNRNQLDSLIAAGKTLTPEELAAQYLPTLVQAQTTANYLKLMGFTNIVIAPNRLLVSADGVADNAKAAFLTSFARVQTREGREAFANTRDAVIPEVLQDSVLSVVGLQNVHQGHGFGRPLQATGVQPFVVAGSSVMGHNPLEFASIYSASTLPTAAGVTVGIFTVGDVTQTLTDLNTYTDNNGLPRVTTEVVNNGSGDIDIGEWDLDSQTIVGTGGGRVGKLVFYSGTGWDYPSLVNTLNLAMTANAAKVINNSWGGCEISAQSSGAAAATDQIFAAAVAQGQTFAFSTGDSGAYECGGTMIGASWPASSPYVVAIAGTTLNASTTTWGGEAVWNAGFGATGGSPSAFEPKPSWQNVLVPGTKRGVADVAFDADQASGSKIIWYGGPSQWGGTSVSAPIFTGIWARVIAAKGAGIGFAAPLLYALPATDFHDVVVGNNNGYSGKVGYDFASGRGSVIASRMIQHIGAINPVVANFSVTSSGLMAKFTDHSSDSAGAITSRAWNFGDGGTSTTTNPSHFYARPGTYRVMETVSGQGGWPVAQVKSVTISR